MLILVLNVLFILVGLMFLVSYLNIGGNFYVVILILVERCLGNMWGMFLVRLLLVICVIFLIVVVLGLEVRILSKGLI